MPYYNKPHKNQLGNNYRKVIINECLSSTAGSDFGDSLVTTVTFGPGVMNASYPVPILDDSDIESTENFVAVLSTTESNVNIIDGTAIVNILDDDCKLYA